MKTLNYWYASRSDEIFLDLDSQIALRRALTVLCVAIRQRKLKVKAIWLYPTRQKEHCHLIIGLKRPMAWATRLAWSMWMGNDRLRCAYILARADNNISTGDLLVSAKQYFRKPDFLCRCTGKHKDKKVTGRCPAMMYFLGKHHSADYFARTGRKLPGRKIRVPWGQVSVRQIERWGQ